MAQDEKPLFPRDLESDSKRQSELLEDAQRQLEAAESKSEFELPNFERNAPQPPMVVYGPPAFMSEQTPPPAPMYGPPGFIIGRRSPVKLIVIIAVLLLIVAAGAGLLLYFFFK